MAYPSNKPSGIYNLREYDFGLDDPKLIPLDEYNFKKGFRNKDESLTDSVPDAHQANWLYNYFNQHINYAEKTADENKYLLETKIATPTNIGQIKVGYGLDITNSGVLSVSKGVAEDARIISYDLPVGSMMLWTGTNPPEYFIEPSGQTLLRTTYADLYEYAVTNDLIGENKLFGEGDGSTTFTIADLRDQFVKIASDTDNVGRKEVEGLPEISGELSLNNQAFGSWYANGVFNQDKTYGTNVAGNGGTGASQRNISFKASRSNPIYGKSDNVTPRNIALKLILKAKPTPPNKTVPIGSIMDYTGTQAPDGFIIANGAELSRDTFSDLYTWAVTNNLIKEQSEIPTTAHAYYGTGNGTTTFTIPDLRGVFRRGADLQSDRGATTVGAYQPDGLPNITGNIYAFAGGGGALRTLYEVNNFGGGGVHQNYIEFNAQKSNEIYGKSDNVQPKNVSLLPILKY